MSDFDQCIANGAAEGKITPDRADKASKLYRDNQNALRGTLPDDELNRAAARATFDQLEREAAEKKRIVRLTEAAAVRITGEMNGYKGPDGPDGGNALLAYFHDDGFSSYVNVRDRYRGVLGYAFADMDGITEDFMRNMLGGQRRAKLLDDVIDASFGKEASSKKVKDYAARINSANEKLRQMFNAAGGHIGKIENWGWPTRHKAELLRRTDFDSWYNYIRERLDVDKMIDTRTMKPFTEDALRKQAHETFEAIKTGGWSRREPSRALTGQAMYNRHAEERFFIFKDGKAWREYQERFGDGKPWDVMLTHMDGLARDIAAMQTFGPNPPAMLRWMMEKVEKAGNTAKGTPKAQEKAARRAKKKTKQAETMWQHYTGEVHQPESVALANFGGGVRNYLTGTLLGGTPMVSVPTDLMNQAMARKFAGMPQAKMLASIVKQLNPASRADRNLAIRSGVVMEHFMQTGLAAQRYLGERTGRGVTGQYADTALRLSLLSQITQSGRSAMQLDLLMYMGGQTSKPFDKLGPDLQRILKRADLDKDWEILRTANVGTEPGRQILNVPAIEAIDMPTVKKRDLIIRLLSLSNMQAEFAVPTGSLKSQAFLRGRVQPGTVIGEIARSFSMFKAFPSTIMFMQFSRTRALFHEQGLRGAASHVAAYLSLTTLAGAFALQMAEISKGRDPLSMDGEAFWAAAMLKGGGLGIWADILSSGDQGYSNSNLSTTVAGPVAGLGEDVLNFTVGNAKAAAAGEDMRLGKDVTDMARNYTPFARTWYSRLAFERLVVDELQKQLDPKAYRVFRDRVRYAQREKDQDYWWAPGERAPDRAPDMSEAFPE